ncbi:MAG: hypothetical protein HYY52_01085 [Candidatus Melainabacteria bacterium]|nr:hypothetical protein [Candidatus Melainabacteria bacterium]
MKTVFFKAINLTIIIQVIFCTVLYAEDFQVKHADSLEADKENIYIKGNILVNYKDATLEAPEGKVENNTNGEVDKAIFTGRAKINLKDRKIEADKITILIKEQIIIAEGKTISQLKDKKNEILTITSDYQEIKWTGENANAKGNLQTSYKETKVTCDEAQVIYKNNKPIQALFWGKGKQGFLEQSTSKTKANKFIFDINSQNVEATGNVLSTVWPDKKKPIKEQEPVLLKTDYLYIDQGSGTITAASNYNNKVSITYEDTNGESTEAFLLRDKINNKPEKIIFKGDASVSQKDKQLSSEEVVFNFKSKKLSSNTTTNKRPKTIIFKSND